jgi:glutathione synthase/RimK-type ligase-like ATP-grasp enzyme
MRNQGVQPVLVDVVTLETTPYVLCDGILTLHSPNGDVRVPLRSPTRGWIRRLAPPMWRAGVTLGTEDAAIRGAWSALITAVAGSADVAWLTPLERLFLRENKLLQVATARRLGIPTPPTAVCSRRDLLPTALGDELVVKPLGRGHYTDAAGTERVVWTTELDRSSELLDRLAGAPFIVQKRLHAERHLRAVTVTDRCWVCELSAGALAVDWRREEAAHHAFVLASNPEVERDAVRMAEAVGVGYSSQDWIVSDGVPHLIDLNPAGQWLFLPEDAASAVTAGIAAWLTP